MADQELGLCLNPKRNSTQLKAPVEKGNQNWFKICLYDQEMTFYNTETNTNRSN